MEYLLSKAPIVESKTPYGLTALGIAAASGNHEMCSLLLENGANVTAADEVGATPLIMASYCGKTDVVQLLLEHKQGGASGRQYILRQATKNGEAAG